MVYDDVSGSNIVDKDKQIPSGINDVAAVYLILDVQSADGDVRSINVKVNGVRVDNSLALDKYNY